MPPRICQRERSQALWRLLAATLLEHHHGALGKQARSAEHLSKRVERVRVVVRRVSKDEVERPADARGANAREVHA